MALQDTIAPSKAETKPSIAENNKRWPLTQWDSVAIVHTTTATGVLALGGAILLTRKGTHAHRWMGRVWVGTMLTTCISSFGLRDLTSGFSWIQGLSAFTIYSVAAGVYHIRRKNIVAHKHFMRGAYVGTVGAGAFALFTPGRRLYNSVFGVPKHLENLRSTQK